MATRRQIIQGSAFVGASIFTRGLARAADPIKVGFPASTSGTQAAAAEYYINAANLAIKQINAAGGVTGRPIQLLIEDDQGTNPGTIAAFNRLADRGDIVAFIGPGTSSQTLAIEPDVRRVGKPMMVIGQDPKLTTLGNPWFFRLQVKSNLSAKAIVTAGVEVLKKTKWAVLNTTDTFGQSTANGLVSSLKERHLEPVLYQSFASGQNDLTTLVLAVKQSSADIITTALSRETDAGILVRQLKELGVTTPLIGGTSLIAPVTIKLAGDALDGAYAMTGFMASASPEAEDFNKKYIAAYGEPPSFGFCFDAINLVARAVTSAGSTEPEALRKAFHGIQGYKGADGVFSFDENGDGLHNLNFIRIEKGEKVFIKAIQV